LSPVARTDADDKGLCIALDFKERKCLFYVEKSSDHKLRLAQVNLEKSHSKVEKKFFSLDSAMQVFNFVAPDWQTVFILMKTTAGYLLRTIDLCSGKQKEAKISPQPDSHTASSFAADFCTFYPEADLVAISCYESSDSYCVSSVKIFDAQTLKLLAKESIRVANPQGRLS
jgi:hypothetical protein